MRGHIRERAPGHWAIVLDIRDLETGKRKRKWHSFQGTKREAQVECSRLITELTSGSYIEPAKTTLGQFLDKWLEHVCSQVAPRTHERYAEIARKSIAPLLGNCVLSRLQPARISAAYAKALAEGRRDGKGGLSPRTVGHMHRILRQALAAAVNWDVLATNPAAKVRPPKVERAKMRALDADETAAAIEAARSTPIFVPTILGALCGLRRGEIAALRWRAVSLENGQLSVVASAEQTRQGVREKETKSGRDRTVAMPTLVVEELRRYRLKQAEELLKVGVRQSEETHVVTRADGEPIQPDSITQGWDRFVVRAGLPRVRFHDLRHTCASLMLREGIHPKIVQERLGHATIAVTLDLYSHVLPGMQADAASRIDVTLKAAIEKLRRKKG
jgi:integrase